VPAAPDISFTYQAKTLDGRLSLPATVSLTVQEVNDPPTAGGDPKNTNEDTALVFASSDLTANDSAGPANESGQTVQFLVTNDNSGLFAAQPAIERCFRHRDDRRDVRQVLDRVGKVLGAVVPVAGTRSDQVEPAFGQRRVPGGLAAER